jgi:hypothetical protein
MARKAIPKTVGTQPARAVVVCSRTYRGKLLAWRLIYSRKPSQGLLLLAGTDKVFTLPMDNRETWMPKLDEMLSGMASRNQGRTF